MKIFPKQTSQPSSQSFKNHVRKRDKVCRICGRNQYLRVCHIIARRDKPWLRNNINNAILLCDLCDWEFGERLREAAIKINYEKK